MASAVTFHGCPPSWGVLAVMTVQDVRPLREPSILMFPVSPLELQRMLCVLSIAQVSPPAGAITVRLPLPRVALALLTSFTVGSVTLVMRMRACARCGPRHRIVTDQLDEI